MIKSICNIARAGFCVIVFWLGAPLVTSAQNTFGNIVNNLKTKRTEEIQEKVYVHVSQNFLLTGETLWFKMYVVDATLHQSLGVSKVGYVELLDDQGNAVLQAKLELNNGEGDGSLFLPASMMSGNYRLRSYTRWMKNFDSSFFFEKEIKIVNPFRSLGLAKKSENEYHVNFFPEGGQLVNGISGKVAFKISDQFGIGKDFSGRVLNSRGETVVTFKPLKFGMGAFEFTPLEGETYKAFIDGEGTDLLIETLPPASSEGYVMKIQDLPEEIIVNVEAVLPAKDTPLIYLFAHSKNVISWAEAQALSESKVTFKIDKNKLREGITHITLFNSNIQPVCERLYFKPVTTGLPLTISSPTGLSQREKISVKIEGDFEEVTETARLSISVAKIDSLNPVDESTIFHYLDLVSDLKGRIESPEYYFSGDENAILAMDNLMLTQGWRRFMWDELQDNSLRERLAPEVYGHIIEGRVIGNLSNNQESKAFLSSPDKSASFYGASVSPEGDVVFNVYNLYGPRKLIFQMGATERVERFNVTDPFSPEKSSYKTLPFELEESHEKLLINRSIDMQIQDVYFEKKINHPGSGSHDSLTFYGSTGKTYYLDDYTRFPVMEEVMREYVPEVIVRKKSGQFVFKVWDTPRETIFTEEPLILLDGVPILNTDWIMAFDPTRVKRLDVFTRKMYLGDFTFEGMVSYLTYHGDLGGFKLNENIVTLDYEGLQTKREFFSPEYENDKTNIHKPDRRQLLYWNPTVKLDESGAAKIEFFTSDVGGDYVIKVEGISSSGRAAFGRATFKVE